MKLETSDQQFAFMPSWSTTDEIFAQRQQVGRYREGQRELYSVLTDLQKACDRVLKAELWNCLRLKK